MEKDDVQNQLGALVLLEQSFREAQAEIRRAGDQISNRFGRLESSLNRLGAELAKAKEVLGETQRATLEALCSRIADE